MQKKFEPLTSKRALNILNKKNSNCSNKKLNSSCKLDDIYDISNKFSKEFRNMNDLKSIEEKYPFKYNENESEKLSRIMKSLYNIHQEYKDKPKLRLSIKKRDLLKSHAKNQKNDDVSENQDPEITIQTPEYKLQRIIAKLEKFSKFDFSESKEYPFNASLILRNKISNGVVILGSNNYKYKVENLNQLDVIVNIIGEYPAKEFEKQESLHIEEFKEINCKEVFETNIITKTGHCVNCYTKPNENFCSYHYLADVIHKHMWSGDRVLIHCQMGHVRSATLLLFYLRKYFFDDVREANEFIGLKREKAGAPTVLLNNIETIVKEK